MGVLNLPDAQVGNMAVCLKSENERFLVFTFNDLGVYVFKVQLKTSKLSRKELKYQIEKGYII